MLVGSTVIAAAMMEENFARQFSDGQNGGFKKFFNNFEPFGNAKRLHLVGGVTLIGSTIFQKEKLADATFTMLKGLLLTEVTVVSLKYLVGRARPVDSNRNTIFRPAKGKYSALPSGHTTNAFTAASILSEYYPRLHNYFYSAAFAVGAQRIVSNAHWLSDVILGGILGHYSGKLLANSHLKLFPIVSQNGAVRVSLSIPLNGN